MVLDKYSYLMSYSIQTQNYQRVMTFVPDVGYLDFSLVLLLDCY